jgi:hypothetical protein
MKKLTVFIFVLCFGITAQSQQGEFKVYENGLIYSEEAMTKLSHVVDSLNLMYRTCEFDKTFLSKQQAIGHYVSLSGVEAKLAMKDIKNNISFADFYAKYTKATIRLNELFLKWKYFDGNGEEIFSVDHFSLRSDYSDRIYLEDASKYNMDFGSRWLMDYNKKTKYSEESITAFYFPENFKSIELPREYSLKIGYSDCLIDTTTSKFKDDLETGWVDLPQNWRSLSDKKKTKMLEDMRSTRVIGYCSMDARPREHAVNIALLSAETYRWEIFLRAHLDIMNDRFERQSDGSYAWGKRNTYIKELESININVEDLILGICFRMENPSTNHYFGSIARVGRALAESQNRKSTEEKILSIVADADLDLYNRLLFFFLFRNYNHFLEDEAEKATNHSRLKDSVASLPENFKAELLAP